MLVKGSIAFVIGGVTWVVSELTQQNVDTTGWTDSLLLSVLVGGMTFLVQYLTQFEQRVEGLETAQRRRLDEVDRLFAEASDARARHQSDVRASLDDNFAKVSRATGIYALMERSPFAEDDFEELLKHANRLGDETPRLLRELIGRELRRLSDTVEQVGSSGSTQYLGEDREWLLALAAAAVRSIDAVSLSTADASPHGFDSGFWTSDLGERYLGLQAEAIARRSVRVRRVFVADRPGFQDDPHFIQILRRQHLKGVEVRILDWAAIPDEHREDVTDVIVFDGELSYELSAAQFGSRRRFLESDHPAQSVRIRTELHSDELVVSNKLAMLEYLWDLGDTPASFDLPDVDVRRLDDVGVPRQPPKKA